MLGRKRRTPPGQEERPCHSRKVAIILANLNQVSSLWPREFAPQRCKGGGTYMIYKSEDVRKKKPNSAGERRYLYPSSLPSLSHQFPLDPSQTHNLFITLPS